MKFDAMTAKVPMSLTKAWIPYVLVALILVLTRVSSEAKAFTTSLAFSYKNILGEGLNFTMALIFTRWNFSFL